MKVKSVLFTLLTIAASAFSVSSYATVVEVDTVPSGWKLENYPGTGGGVVVYYTPAQCMSNGELVLPSSATTDDINRFWALMMSAMIAQQQLFVRYDDQTCIIQSFGMY